MQAIIISNACPKTTTIGTTCNASPKGHCQRPAGICLHLLCVIYNILYYFILLDYMYYIKENDQYM